MRSNLQQNGGEKKGSLSPALEAEAEAEDPLMAMLQAGEPLPSSHGGTSKPKTVKRASRPRSAGNGKGGAPRPRPAQPRPGNRRHQQSVRMMLLVGSLAILGIGGGLVAGMIASKGTDGTLEAAQGLIQRGTARVEAGLVGLERGLNEATSELAAIASAGSEEDNTATSTPPPAPSTLPAGVLPPPQAKPDAAGAATRAAAASAPKAAPSARGGEPAPPGQGTAPQRAAATPPQPAEPPKPKPPWPVVADWQPGRPDPIKPLPLFRGIDPAPEQIRSLLTGEALRVLREAEQAVTQLAGAMEVHARAEKVAEEADKAFEQAKERADKASLERRAAEERARRAQAAIAEAEAAMVEAITAMQNRNRNAGQSAIRAMQAIAAAFNANDNSADARAARAEAERAKAAWARTRRPITQEDLTRYERAVDRARQLFRRAQDTVAQAIRRESEAERRLKDARRNLNELYQDYMRAGRDVTKAQRLAQELAWRAITRAGSLQGRKDRRLASKLHAFALSGDPKEAGL